jgi:DNA-binding MarR family transcriptional regulator
MSDEPHSTLSLDDTVHQRARLGILTILQETGTADFPYLKSALQLTDGNLGRHIEVLADGGLVQVKKGYEGRRPRTWVTITKTGRTALAVEMDALKALVARFEQTAPPEGGPAGPPLPPGPA